MNGRVFLLVLVTGLFMAAWDADQAAMAVALAKRAQLHANPVATVNHRKSPDTAPLSLQLASIKQPRVHELPRASDDIVPLPPGITAGHYQAVNQAGVSIRLNVTARDSKGTADRDFYVVDANDGERWYLVRITR